MAKRFVLPGFLGELQDSIKKNPLRALGWAFAACAVLLVAAAAVAGIALGALSEELRSRSGQAEALARNLTELSRDYNQLRLSLGLEPRAFAHLEETAGGTDAPSSPLAQGLAIIQSRFYDEGKARRFEEFKTGPLYAMLPAETGCAPVDAGLFAVNLVKKGNVYYALSFKPDAMSVSLTAAGTRESWTGADKDAAAAFIRSTLPKIDAYYVRVAGLKAALAGLGAGEPAAAKLKERGLAFEYRGEDAAGFKAAVTREKEDLLTVTFDKAEGTFRLNEKKVDPENLVSAFDAALASLDARTAAEKRVDAVRASLEESFREAGFAAACREASMEVSAAPRMNDDFVFYDVSHRGRKIGAFAVEKRGAAVYFTDKDDVVIASLRSVSGGSDFKKKTITAAAEPGGSKTILLLGLNEKNTDTMILVRADSRTKGITLVSLPRDLFWRGRKINRLHEKGLDFCLREISAITGVPVDKYALVDLYSLIAVIDALGGVDIDLPYDVVDPTYRIKEHGVWSTLAYPRGRHHLSGVQAMRLIRSRGSTSDFQRSRRQELILAALFEKLKTRCGGSLEAALSVFSALAGYVATNLSPFEIAREFTSFKDYSIKGSYVIDTTNMLRATYAGIFLLPEEEQAKLLAENDPVKLDAYILLPRDNDWNLLQSYIRRLLMAH